MSSIPLLLLKASLLLGVAIVAARFMRGAAARRHALWSGAFAALLLLPILGALLPAIEVKVPQAATMIVPSAQLNAVADVTTPSSLVGTTVIEEFATSGPATRMPTVAEALMAVWLTGAAIAVAALIVSLIRIARLANRGQLIIDRQWRTSVDRIARDLGLPRPIRLVADASVVTPMAAGLWTPTIFVPSDAAGWSVDRREVVLAHEVAHLASRDPVRHLISRIAVILYWFHPLAWIASRQATAACEQACDEAVLSLGVRPSAYAEILLDFASGAPMGAPVAALPIVRRNLLETRLMAILDPSPRSGGRRIILPAALGVGLALSIAAIRPGAGIGPAMTPSAALPVASVFSPVSHVVSPAPKATPLPVTISPVQAAAACERGGWNGDFNGTMTSSRDGVVDRAIQRRSSDFRVCMAGERMPRGESRPSEWASQAEQVVLETEERSGDLRRMEIIRGVTTYSVNGRPAPITANVQEWRTALIAAMDATWEANQLQGQINSLRGEINSIHGDRNSLQGEINSLQGQVNSMQGEINSVRGQENSLRGEINSINGELNSMRGEINSEQGSINSLQASRYDRLADRDAIDARIRRHQDNIRRIEDRIADYNADRRIREVERRIASFDADGKVAEIERRIRDFDLEGKTAAIRRRIAQLDVEGQSASIEREIQGLRGDDRLPELERRADLAMRELRAKLR
jgi:beta-lactamase regulating signal transducer with metallopeptidase domain